MAMRIMLLLAAALIAAGCGGDDEEDAVQDAATALTETEDAQEDAQETLDDAVETLEDVVTEAEDLLEDALTFDLEEQNDSGISGTVELSPTSEGQLEVEVELDGSSGGPHPAHIHEGSCADLDPEPAFPLEDVVDGRSTTTVEVELGELTASEYAVNVHESPENASVYVACADVRSR